MTTQIQHFFDTRTFTLTYVVFHTETLDAVVIDPVLDYDPKASKTWTESADQAIAFIKDHNLNLRYILETHAHADHLSGSQIFKQHFPQATLAVGSRITEVQSVFKTVFDLPSDFPTDGRQFDALLDDGQLTKVGPGFEFETIFTPGHTPACVTFKIGDAIFTGDALFMPDSGTGRCDFPAGSATDLYQSITERIYTLPPTTQIFVGHDYQPGGRPVRYQTTVAESMDANVQLRAGTPKDDFVTFRTQRDATLEAPRLLFQSVQVNVDAGALPQPHDNQIRYLRIPINVFRPEPQAGQVEARDI